jgi:trehalose 2-sulfotransferase
LIEELFNPQDHEVAVTKHFGSLAYYQGSLIFDAPLYLLGFSNRSGSNLMAEHLYSTERFALFEESLNSDIVIDTAKSMGLKGFPEVIQYFVQAMMQSGRLPGFKANWGQITMLNRLGILRMFPEVRLVNMVRKDVVGQAVSFSIASQTGQWFSSQPSAKEPDFSFPDIADRLFGTSFGNFATDLIALALEIKAVTVTYEDLENDPGAAVNEVATTFGLDLRNWEPRPTKLQRQRTLINQAMKERFLSEFRERMSK